MDKTCRIVLNIPGDNRAIAADVVLGDLARKLKGCELVAGQHEILIFNDGSIVVDAAMQWTPTRTAPVVDNRRKAG